MIDRIIKPSSKQTIDAIKSGDFSEVQKIRGIARQNAADIFRVVSSGAVPLIWYDLPPVRTYKLFRAVKTLLFFSCPASAPGGVGS